jgi:hypothetical protein
VRVADEKDNIFIRLEKINKINATTTVYEQKYVAVFFILLECPLKAFNTQYWSNREDDIFGSEQCLQNF